MRMRSSKLILLLIFLVSTGLAERCFTEFLISKDIDAYNFGRKLRNIKIITLRHLESHANEVKNQLIDELGSRAKANRQILKEADSLTLVDTLLTPKGAEQAQEVGEKLSNIFPNIKYVFVSPMRRAVDSAVKVIQNYSPNHDPIFILNPWLRERFNGMADLPYYSYTHLRKYPQIDRSRLSSNPKFWFIDYFVENPKTHSKELIEQAISSPTPLRGLGKLLRSESERLERPSQIGKRLAFGLNEIREFVDNLEAKGLKVKDHEILVVTHGFLLCQLYGYKVIHDNDTYGGLHGGNFYNGDFKVFELTRD